LIVAEDSTVRVHVLVADAPRELVDEIAQSSVLGSEHSILLVSRRVQNILVVGTDHDLSLSVLGIVKQDAQSDLDGCQLAQAR
ncbi:hypothetical protein PFISCL1PPCAC_18927, partial [Pristionchus fissidentatus]